MTPPHPLRLSPSLLPHRRGPPSPAHDTLAGPPPAFTPYQKFVVGMLAFLQFAVILDFMIDVAAGRADHAARSTSRRAQFGLVVSAYAFSAGVSGLLAAGFADRFDRKKLLLFFYTGFIAGHAAGAAWRSTLSSPCCCARIVTGIFGGVIGSVVLAIATDLFPPQHARPRDGLHPDGVRREPGAGHARSASTCPTAGTGMCRSS